MQEAFRKALHVVEAEPQSSLLDRRSLRVIQLSPGSSSEGVHDAEPAHMQKLVYAAHKLAQRWSRYTNQGGNGLGVLDRLQCDWIVLVTQLTRLPQEQRLTILSEIMHGIEPEDQRSESRRIAYLKLAARAHPEHFVGLDHIPGVPWPGLVAFLIHTIEELAACSVVERQQLHASLAEDGTDWQCCLAQLDRWLGTRWQATEQPYATSA